jgi:UDP-N-acetylglucosamine acyltransferase
MANSYLSGNTIIGANNEIHMGCVVGHVPQHLGYKGQPTVTIVGDGNVFREYVTIHRASDEEHKTTIGNRCFFMAMSHVAHDAVVGDDVIMANGTLLAGHTRIEDKVVLSGNVGVHQHCAIGAMCMIGGLSKIVQDIPPFMLVDGGSEVCGINVIGLRRAGFDAATREKVKQAYKILYRSELNVSNAVAEMEAKLGDCLPVQQMIEFIRKSQRGISRHTRQARD